VLKILYSFEIIIIRRILIIFVIFEVLKLALNIGINEYKFYTVFLYNKEDFLGVKLKKNWKKTDFTVHTNQDLTAYLLLTTIDSFLLCNLCIFYIAY